MPFAVAHLVEADHEEVVEPLRVELAPDDTLDNPPDGDPGDVHEARDGRLVHLTGEPSHDLLKVEREV